MAHKVYINNQDIIEIEVIGDQTPEGIQAMGEDIQMLLATLKKQNKPQLILDNLLHIGQVPVEARERVVELAKTLPYDRLAMLGKGGLIRVSANLLLRATGRAQKTRYFDNRAKAIAWLTGRK